MYHGGHTAVCLLLDSQKNADNAGEERNTFDKCCTDDHRRTYVTSIFGLTAAGFKSGSGQTANARANAKYGDADAETGCKPSK
jgi:hypothetical protein